MPTRSKFTVKTRKAIIASVAKGVTRTAACQAAGISRNTFHRWLKSAKEHPGGRYAAFLDELEEAEAKAEVAHTITLEEASHDDPKWAAWWLERRRRDVYGKTDRQEITGRDGEPIHVVMKWPQGPQTE